MSLISTEVSQWRLNKINCGAPYHVELVGPWRLPQVQDARGTVAVSGPDGAVFCPLPLAEAICKAANENVLEKQQ